MPFVALEALKPSPSTELGIAPASRPSSGLASRSHTIMMCFACGGGGRGGGGGRMRRRRREEEEEEERKEEEEEEGKEE